MLNPIPWYVVIFQSLPESFLIIKLGLSFFRLDISNKENLIISSISGIISFLIRKYIPIFGLHTVITVITLIVFLSLISKIRFEYSFIAIFMGVIVTGALQSIIVPVLLSVNNMEISDLGNYPIFNIIFFLPCALVIYLIYMIIQKKKLYLMDLKTDIEV